MHNNINPKKDLALNKNSHVANIKIQDPIEVKFGINNTQVMLSVGKTTKID